MADNDLIFSRALSTAHPVDLVFGEIDTPQQFGPLVAFVGVAAALVGSTHGVSAGALVVALTPVSAALAGVSVPRTAVRLSVQAGAGWEGASARTSDLNAANRSPQPVVASPSASWGGASGQTGQTAAPWRPTTPGPVQTTPAWAPGTRAATAARAIDWQAATRRGQSGASAWEQGQHTASATVKERWQELTRTAAQQLDAWGEATRRAHSRAMPWGEASGRAVGGLFPWQLGHPRDPGRSELPVIPPEPPGHVCYYPPPGGAVVLVFDELAAEGDTRLEFFCGRRPAQGVIPIKRTYLVENDVTLTVVGSGAVVPTLGASLALDADSWTWGFSASIPGSAQALVTPAPGDQVELNLAINGADYRVVVESISRERVFNSSALRVSGRGRSALLDSPNAPVQSFTNSLDRNAQQLMQDVLALTGWTIDWGLQDWSVPAGVWVFQGSPIGALTAIAGAVGGYIQPHPTADIIRVLPKYPTAPWTWASMSADFVLPAAIVSREAIDWINKPAYNRVFVSGLGAGVLGQVTRTGTAGDLLAPMATDALITDAVAARQRGLSVLSDSGAQARASLKLPVTPYNGVILPGASVEYVDDGVIRRGLVRSVTVDAGFPEVWQTIGVETHV